eukprot:261435-Chlamydomonas_euryale.AAC.1
MHNISHSLHTHTRDPPHLVQLHSCELWVVARRDALVAEDAAELKHALKAADDHALEVQLGGDAQCEVAPQRVVVRDEWAR